MQVLTKRDLQEWNSHPVTIAVFKEVDSELKELSNASPLRDTCDATAMRAAEIEGLFQGANAFKEAYEVLKERENDTN